MDNKEAVKGNGEPLNDNGGCVKGRRRDIESQWKHTPVAL